MKVVCFIGSGFNYLLADIVKPLKGYTFENVTLYEKLISLNKLWYQFDPLFIPFQDFIHTRNGEEILEAIEGFHKVYESFISDQDKIETQKDKTYPLHLARIEIEMRKVGERFAKFEKSGGYSVINQAFPNIGKAFNNSLKQNHVSDFFLCSTNYDGIIDSLLTYYCNRDLRRKFILIDGFIHGNFNPEFFQKSKYKLAHIHGSHRYYEGANGTVKLERGVLNCRPVMIYNNPQRKEAAIKKDNVLSANLLELERQLAICDKVITIGNSFKTEPHLKDLIKSKFNRPRTQMIVCSDKPDEVVSFLEPYYDFPIYQQSTENVTSEEQLIKLFNQLFSATNLNMLATA